MVRGKRTLLLSAHRLLPYANQIRMPSKQTDCRPGCLPDIGQGNSLLGRTAADEMFPGPQLEGDQSCFPVETVRTGGYSRESARAMLAKSRHVKDAELAAAARLGRGLEREPPFPGQPLPWVDPDQMWEFANLPRRAYISGLTLLADRQGTNVPPSTRPDSCAVWCLG